MSSEPDTSMQMGFWDHVEALRGVILRSVGLVVLLTVGWFAVMPQVFDEFILAPCRPDFITYRLLGAPPEEIHLINIQLTSQFFIHASASLWLAVITAFPAVVMMVWGFISPGLYESEKRGAPAAFAATVAMFLLGAATGYFMVFPLTLRFLAGYQLSALVPNQISLDSYIDNFMTLILVMGAVFELPVVTWLLGRFGLLDRTLFALYRRHAIVALLIAAAVITPTGDPFTLLIVFAPLYLLWEASALTVPKLINS